MSKQDQIYKGLTANGMGDPEVKASIGGTTSNANIKAGVSSKIANDIIKTTKDFGEKWMKAMAQSFKGIPVRVDLNLDGMSYYIAISPDLFRLLEDQKLKET